MRRLSLVVLLAGCASTHTESADGGMDAAPVVVDVGVDAGLDAAPDNDAGLDAAIDTGPPPACDLSGDWSGTRMDVSRTPPGTMPLTFRFTQAGSALTVWNGTDVIGHGTITGTSVDFYTGATPPGDASTNTYSGTVASACDRIDGEWWAFEMAHGPLALDRL